jgi:hypothetical protein
MKPRKHLAPEEFIAFLKDKLVEYEDAAARGDTVMAYFQIRVAELGQHPARKGNSRGFPRKAPQAADQHGCG